MEKPAVKDFEPINQLSDSRKSDLLRRSHREVITARKRIRSTDYRYCFLYLLDGKIILEPKNQEEISINAHSKRAAKPLFTASNYMDSLVSSTDCEFLKVDRALFEQVFKDQTADGMEVDDIQVQLSDGTILRQLFDDYKLGSIPVPSMPEIAIKVQELAESEDASLADLSKLIEIDPPISGKIISAANSVLLRGRSQIHTVRDSLIRLGMKTARQLIIGMAMKELFNASLPVVQNRMRRCWEHSVKVALISRLIATKTGAVDSDKAFLIGLLHDVGAVSILAYLESTNDKNISEGLIAQALAGLRTLVSVLVLQSWRMDDEIIQAIENAGQIDAEIPDEAGYLEILNLAKHQAWLVSDSGKTLPPISKLPGAKRFNMTEVNEDGLLMILAENIQEIDALNEIIN